MRNSITKSSAENEVASTVIHVVKELALVLRTSLNSTVQALQNDHALDSTPSATTKMTF